MRQAARSNASRVSQRSLGADIAFTMIVVQRRPQVLQLSPSGGTVPVRFGIVTADLAVDVTNHHIAEPVHDRGHAARSLFGLGVTRRDICG